MLFSNLLWALVVLVSVGTGLVVGWLLTRASLRSRLSDRSADLVAARESLERERIRNVELERDLANEKGERSAREAATAEKLALLENVQERWLSEVDALSRRALDSNAKSFIELARGQFEQLVTKSTERGEQQRLKMEQLVQPLGESLKQVREHLSVVEKDRTDAYATLTQQVASLAESQRLLQKEAGNLVNALRRPSVRGRWGEVQLRRVVELAGMVSYCDFDEQHTVRTDEGLMRPDLVVRLPGGRIIVVDAKTPLEAYLDAMEAQDDADRDAGVKRHAAQVRTHVRKLATKAYFDQFDTTPDLVILFLPGESFFYAAAQADSSLVEFAVDNNVVIATPMTLIALLRAVAYGWRQEQAAENARRIGALGQELYDRICSLTEHFVRMGSGLKSAVTAYNKGVGSLESRVLVSARRFRDLGSGSSRAMDGLSTIDDQPRALSAAEFTPPPLLALSGDGDGDGEPAASKESDIDRV